MAALFQIHSPIDLLLPDDLWDKIKSDGKCDGAGMLCGSCIMDRIEKISGYDAWILSKELPVVTGKWLYDIMNNMDYDDTFEKLADEINKFIRGEV